MAFRSYPQTDVVAGGVYNIVTVFQVESVFVVYGLLGLVVGKMLVCLVIQPDCAIIKLLLPYPTSCLFSL